MNSYVVSPEASEDIFKIWRYLAKHADVETASRVESEIYEAFAMLSLRPGMGHKREDLTSHSVLFFAVYSYLIVYRRGTPVEIARVLHGRRNVQRLLRHLSR